MKIGGLYNRYLDIFYKCFNKPMRINEIIKLAKSERIGISSFKNKYLPNLRKMALITTISDKEILNLYNKKDLKGEKERGRPGNYYSFTPLCAEMNFILKNLIEGIKIRFDIFLSKDEVDRLNSAVQEYIISFQKMELIPKERELRLKKGDNIKYLFEISEGREFKFLNLNLMREHFWALPNEKDGKIREKLLRGVKSWKDLDNISLESRLNKSELEYEKLKIKENKISSKLHKDLQLKTENLQKNIENILNSVKLRITQENLLKSIIKEKSKQS